MAESNIDRYETSTQDGSPVECYKFTYRNMNYLYTSADTDIELEFIENGVRRTEKYFADHIKRGNIKPGGMGSAQSSTIEVLKDHPIAKLFQGPPPEFAVHILVYRLHDQDHTKWDVALSARINQANFSGSDCELVARQENWLSKELPNGTYQYYCNNTVFSQNCGLVRGEWEVKALIKDAKGLHIYSDVLAEYKDGYFIGGRIYFQDYVRTITEHEGNRIKLKYPFPGIPYNEVTILPGCDHLFKTCAERYQNTVNYTGCPYVPPTDPEKNPTGQGAYWIDSAVVKRDTDGYVGSISL